MSPVVRVPKRKGHAIPTKRNFIANPGKKGTGYGYGILNSLILAAHICSITTTTTTDDIS